MVPVTLPAVSVKSALDGNLAHGRLEGQVPLAAQTGWLKSLTRPALGLARALG